MKNVENIQKFLKQIPKADLTIILNSSYEQLLSILEKRGDLSPRVKSKEHLIKFIKSANKVYNIIQTNRNIKNTIFFDTDKYYVTWS